CLRLLRPDGDRATVGGDLLGAEAPEDRRESGDGVRSLTDGEADRVAQLLELPARSQQIVPGVGRLLADLLEEVDAMASRKREVEVGDAQPLALDVRVLPGERIPVAVLAREVVRDVRHVDQPRG